MAARRYGLVLQREPLDMYEQTHALIGSFTGYQLVYHEYGKLLSWLKDLMNQKRRNSSLA